MTNPRDVIISLKKVRDEKGLSYAKILSLMEQNGDFLSPSTLSRVFADGSEEPENAKKVPIRGYAPPDCKGFA